MVMLNVNLKKEVMSNLENVPSRLFKFQEWADTKLHHQGSFLFFFFPLSCTSDLNPHIQNPGFPDKADLLNSM